LLSAAHVDRFTAEIVGNKLNAAYGNAIYPMIISTA
jgi:hypothetical protein